MYAQQLASQGVPEAKIAAIMHSNQGMDNVKEIHGGL
jgi:hypothetical protein